MNFTHSYYIYQLSNVILSSYRVLTIHAVCGLHIYGYTLINDRLFFTTSNLHAAFLRVENPVTALWTCRNAACRLENCQLLIKVCPYRCIYVRKLRENPSLLKSVAFLW